MGETPECWYGLFDGPERGFGFTGAEAGDKPARPSALRRRCGLGGILYHPKRNELRHGRSP